jgi:tetratricopeptide (TPR) repeat protein
VDDLLRTGIAAAKSGQRERAYDLLVRVVEADQENVQAWLWLSSVVDGLDDKEICLENVLALDPGNEVARKGLAWLREQNEAAASATVESASSTPPAPPVPDRKPVSAAAAVLREDFARRQPPPEPELELPPLPPRDEFEDEYLCPYCAAQTAPGDRKCPACGNKLWVQVRRREERSSWLWIALSLQAASVIWPAFISLLILFYAARQAGLDNFFRLVPVYLGLPGDVPPELASAAFEAVPRLYVLPLALYILFSLLVMVGLYLRWKPVFYLYLANALLALGSAVVGMAMGLGSLAEEGSPGQGVGLICGGGGLILGLLMFFLVLQIVDDFFLDEKRLLLRLDRDATNGPALLNSGQRYAKRAMWAMAAIHLRRAAGLMPHQVDPHLALTVAYLNLKRYDLATGALEEARRIAPNHPQVEYLASMLVSQRAAGDFPLANTAP